jgi:hypothetical protein
MIGLEDVEYHVPESIDYKYAETNYFIAMIPEEHILATFYTVTRKSRRRLPRRRCDLSAACQRQSRRDALSTIASSSSLRPSCLSRFETPNGLSVHAFTTRATTRLDYVGFRRYRGTSRHRRAYRTLRHQRSTPQPSCKGKRAEKRAAAIWVGQGVQQPLSISPATSPAR